MPSKTKYQFLKAYKISNAMLKSRGFTSRLQRLDNKASDILKEYMNKKYITFQLTLEGLHRCNNVERVIQTFKNYLSWASHLHAQISHSTFGTSYSSKQSSLSIYCAPRGLTRDFQHTITYIKPLINGGQCWRHWASK